MKKGWCVRNRNKKIKHKRLPMPAQVDGKESEVLQDQKEKYLHSLGM